MNAMATPIALHRGAEELPFVTISEGLKVQVLHADIEAGFPLPDVMTPQKRSLRSCSLPAACSYGRH